MVKLGKKDLEKINLNFYDKKNKYMLIKNKCRQDNMKMRKQNKNVNIKNKKALYNFFVIEKYIAGLKLLGHEVKSIKNNNANLENSFCKILKTEIFLLNLYLNKINKISSTNSTSRNILLLLKKKEIIKISEAVKKFALNIIPENIFSNKKGLLKLVIHLAQSKKKYDKREIIKTKEFERFSKIL
ncbi:SsrA-binding protein [Candidatus Karelsulcia muelleri]